MIIYTPLFTIGSVSVFISDTWKIEKRLDYPTYDNKRANQYHVGFIFVEVVL